MFAMKVMMKVMPCFPDLPKKIFIAQYLGNIPFPASSPRLCYAVCGEQLVGRRDTALVLLAL